MADRIAELTTALAGRYRVERELGVGGMATVYLAHDLRQDRDVAIKVLRPEIATSIGVERFVRETGIAGRLAHPNILPVFDFATVTVDGQSLPCYVMPLVDGESLRTRLVRERQLQVGVALRILGDIAAALDYAHAHAVIHRDVKPENILLSGDRALLADFGIARAVQQATPDGAHLTATGVAIGTPAYMSPEQAAADPLVDHRTDSYALAVVAYELLAGEPPFTGATPQAILARQVTGAMHPLATIRPTVATEAMDQVFRRALAPAAADRYPGAGAFVAALEASAAKVSSPRPEFSRRTRAGVSIAAALTLACALAWWQLTRGNAGSDVRLSVGVMPFRDQGNATEWSEALPDLVSTFLDGTPGVRVADPWALWRPLRTRSDAPARSPDPVEADRLSRRAGVRRFVMGGVVRTAQRINLTLRIYGVGVADPLATFTLAGSVDSAAYLAQRTAVEVLTRVWEGSDGPPVPRMESVLTQSPDALKAYLAAREAMRRGLIDSANTAITTAITIDSTFALGLLEAVMVRSWAQATSGQAFSGLLELAQRAKSHGDSLSERQRLRLAGTTALLETNGADAAEAWSQLLLRDSTDLEAVNAMTYTLLAYGWQFGGERQDLQRWSERAVQLDSGDAATLYRRAMVALGSGDTADVRRQLFRLRAQGADRGLIRATQRGVESVVATDADFTAMVDTLSVTPLGEWTTILRMLRAYRPERAVVFARRSHELSLPGPARVLSANAFAGVLGAAGALGTVDSLWNAGAMATAEGPPVRLLQRIIHAALAGVEDSVLTARAVRTLSNYFSVDSGLAWIGTRPVTLAAFTLGAWNASRGDTAIARRWIDVVGRFGAVGHPATWRESIQADIASRLAERRGQLDSARMLGSRALALWTIHTENVGDVDVEPAIRFRHAQLLQSAGLSDSAARILGSFVPPTSWIGTYVPLAHLQLATIDETAKRTVEAADHYVKALALLRMGDGSVAALRSRAEQGLVRVRR